MRSLRSHQITMRDHALDRADAGALVEAVRDDHPIPVADRLRIHRNNTILGLSDALASTYPVCRRLVGENFFAMVARDFVRAHPPSRAPLSFWGAEFPSFLADYAPATALPYLPDVAILEAAWSHAYYAAEAEPLDPVQVMAFPQDRTGDLVFALHPSVRFIASSFPIETIWLANQPGAPDDSQIELTECKTTLVVYRPGSEVIVRAVGAGAFAFLMALRLSQPISVAWEAALAVEPEFHLVPEFGMMLSAGLFVEVRLP